MNVTIEFADFEAARDQLETSFTSVLRRLLKVSPTILGVAFVDKHGECVDYCSRIDPFEVKVNAAHLAIVMDEIRRTLDKNTHGEPIKLMLNGTRRHLIARRINDEYTAVLTAGEGAPLRKLMDHLELAAHQLREEARATIPPWERFGRGDTLGLQRRTCAGCDPALWRATGSRQDSRTLVRALLGQRWPSARFPRAHVFGAGADAALRRGYSPMARPIGSSGTPDACETRVAGAAAFQ
jgi:predicted regulator of Ras-like GTPase activity (Roadblock/LC7/MglB family)